MALVFLAHGVGDEFVHAAGKNSAGGPCVRWPPMRKILPRTISPMLQSGSCRRPRWRKCRSVPGRWRAPRRTILWRDQSPVVDFIGVFAAAVVSACRDSPRHICWWKIDPWLRGRLRRRVLGRDEFQAGGLAIGFFAEQVGDLQVDVVPAGGSCGRLRSVCWSWPLASCVGACKRAGWRREGF